VIEMASRVRLAFAAACPDASLIRHIAAISTARACAAIPRGRRPVRSTATPFALTRTVLPQANAYAMIRRGAAAAGIATELGNHSFRATGINRVPQERRHAGESCGDGEPRLNSYDAGL
jgi:hypothetical protein